MLLTAERGSLKELQDTGVEHSRSVFLRESGPRPLGHLVMFLCTGLVWTLKVLHPNKFRAGLYCLFVCHAWESETPARPFLQWALGAF